MPLPKPHGNSHNRATPTTAATSGGRFSWLSRRVGLFDKPRKFVQDGALYEHADPQPDHGEGSVTRFEPRTEPKVIAKVPLAGGDPVEIHGYATFYSQEWVHVVWTDENFEHMSCWVRAGDTRRPVEGEWRGRYVQF